MKSTSDFDTLATRIESVHRSRHAIDATLVGISGIDGSGKGFVAGELASRLIAGGIRVAVLNIDIWLEVPSKRFSAVDPGRHFYHHGIRIEEMFRKLVLPLRANRSIRLEERFVDSTNTEISHPHIHEYESIDVILLEGVFLFSRKYAPLFDLKIWIDCTFETALERSLARNQEGLSADEIRRDYAAIYFPAQRIHFEEETPSERADIRFANDARFAGKA